MLQIFAVAMLSILFMSASQAQVRKCVGPDGKVTYSDFICAGSTVKESAVNTNVNHLDRSDERKDVDKFLTSEKVEQAVQAGQSKCKFAYFKLGDEKGKVLAAAAKKECLENIAAKVKGEPTSQEAYNFWKDHSTQKSADMQKSLDRASAAANAQAIANSNRQAIDAAASRGTNRTIRCEPVPYQKGFECR